VRERERERESEKEREGGGERARRHLTVLKASKRMTAGVRDCNTHCNTHAATYNATHRNTHSNLLKHFTTALYYSNLPQHRDTSRPSRRTRE